MREVRLSPFCKVGGGDVRGQPGRRPRVAAREGARAGGAGRRVFVGGSVHGSGIAGAAPAVPQQRGCARVGRPDGCVAGERSEHQQSRCRAPRAWQLRAELLIEKAGRALGSRFGGIWIDEADHGRIKVGAVGAKAADQEWLDAQGFRGAADIVDVPRSLSDLEAAVDWLWSRAAALNQEAVDRGASWTLAVSITPAVVPPTSTSRRPRTDPNSSAPSSRKRRPGWVRRCTLRSTKPRHTRAPALSAFPRTATPPLRAGIAIDYPADCTGGFPARSRSDNKLYQLTAGHCTRNRENVAEPLGVGTATRRPALATALQERSSAYRGCR